VKQRVVFLAASFSEADILAATWLGPVVPQTIEAKLMFDRYLLPFVRR
jgi:hypothetical protein